MRIYSSPKSLFASSRAHHIMVHYYVGFLISDHEEALKVQLNESPANKTVFLADQSALSCPLSNYMQSVSCPTNQIYIKRKNSNESVSYLLYCHWLIWHALCDHLKTSYLSMSQLRNIRIQKKINALPLPLSLLLYVEYMGWEFEEFICYGMRQYQVLLSKV